MNKHTRTKSEQDWYYWQLAQFLLSGHSFKYSQRLAKEAVRAYREVQAGTLR